MPASGRVSEGYCASEREADFLGLRPGYQVENSFLIDHFAMKNIYFLTFTINNWIPVFSSFPETKSIIYQGFSYLYSKENVKILGFVIMKDHLHFLAEFKDQQHKDRISKNFRSFISKQIIKFLFENYPNKLDYFRSGRTDRKYKFWKLSKGDLLIKSSTIFLQKLNYIHQNPTKGNYKVCDISYEYEHSSAMSYYLKESHFSFLEIVENTSKVF